MLLRRLRSVASIALLWAAPWAVLGAILGLRFVLFYRASLLIIPALSAVCAIYGTLAGIVFGVAIIAMVRWRLLDRVSVTWVSLIVGFAGFLLGARAEPGYAAAVLFTLFAAACAAGSLRIARAPAPAT